MNELSDKIESILFVSNKPLNAKILSKILNETEENIIKAVSHLAEARKNTGIVLLGANGNFQLATNAKNSEVVTAFLNSDLREKLTDASIEVLAIIAYRQPISRSEIEAIRGVNSQYSIRHLLMRGLIEKLNNPGDARGSLYQITTEFLQHMGITDVKELPQFDELVKNIKLPETPDTKPTPNAPLESETETETETETTKTLAETPANQTQSDTEDKPVILYTSPDNDAPVMLSRAQNKEKDTAPKPQEDSMATPKPETTQPNQDTRIMLNTSLDDAPAMLSGVKTENQNETIAHSENQTSETPLPNEHLTLEPAQETHEIHLEKPVEQRPETYEVEENKEQEEEPDDSQKPTTPDPNANLNNPSKPLSPPRPPKITINNTAF